MNCQAQQINYEDCVISTLTTRVIDLLLVRCLLAQNIFRGTVLYYTRKIGINSKIWISNNLLIKNKLGTLTVLKSQTNNMT